MSNSDDTTDRDGTETQRLDKWLWYSRVLKSRTLAAQLVVDGRVRLNRTRVTKPSQSVRAGDVLTITVRGKVQIMRVLAPGCRRGPPAEARLLYEDLESRDSPEGQPTIATGKRDPGAGRPSKRDRRLIDRLVEGE